MIESERPVHVVLTGQQVTSTPLTNEQWAAHEQRRQAAGRATAQAQAQRAADLALVTEKAAADPAFAALVRLLGLAPPTAAAATPAPEGGP